MRPSGADLRGAKLNGAELDPNALSSAILDGERTKLERIKDAAETWLERRDERIKEQHERGELTVTERIGEAWWRGVTEPITHVMDWVEEKRFGPPLPALPVKEREHTPPPQQSTPAAEKTPALNAQLPPGWSVEKVAQNKALAAEISQIEDPQRRAEAERLLSGIKQEAEARHPVKEREKALELEP